jgi:hypothetical protein
MKREAQVWIATHATPVKTNWGEKWGDGEIGRWGDGEKKPRKIKMEPISPNDLGLPISPSPYLPNS